MKKLMEIQFSLFSINILHDFALIYTEKIFKTSYLTSDDGNMVYIIQRKIHFQKLQCEHVNLNKLNQQVIKYRIKLYLNRND